MQIANVTEKNFLHVQLQKLFILLLHEKELWLVMEDFHGGYSHAHWQNNRKQFNMPPFSDSLHLHIKKLLWKPEAASTRVLILFLQGES